MTRICPIALVILTVLAGCRSTPSREECLFKLLHRRDFAAAEALLAKEPARINGEYCDMENVDKSSQDPIEQAKCSFTQGKPLLCLFADNPKIIKWLLDHGAKIDRQRSLEWGSPLHSAAIYSLSSTKLMIEAIENEYVPLDLIANSEDSSGKTALYYAITARNYAVAEYLLGSGVSINDGNSRRKTVLDLVIEEILLIGDSDAPDSQKRIAELKEAAIWIRKHGGKRSIELDRRWVKERDKQEKALRKRLRESMTPDEIEEYLKNLPFF